MTIIGHFMGYSVCLACIVLAIGCPAPALAQQEPGEIEAKPPPETKPKAQAETENVLKEKLAPFRAYEGEWVGVQKYAEVDENGAFETKSEWTGKFVLDGSYFEMVGKSEYPAGTASYRWMITYDLFQRKYRAWTFNSNGMVTEWNGDYDEARKEFIWKFEDKRAGIKGWLRTSAIATRVTGTGEAKDKNSRLVSDYDLEFRRKKIRI